MSGGAPSRTEAWSPGVGPAGRAAPSKTRPFRFGSMEIENPDPPISRGSVLGDKYRVLELIGEGGMGRVYLAEHVYLQRRVALKLLRRDANQDAETVARFEQEARAASRIGHPAIVEIIDFARLPDGNVFLAMELLHGQSLEDWMAGPGRLDQALPWIAEVARGLHAAHEAGVVHRDVKPANIFLQLGDDGAVTPKVLDFGIAKLTRGEGQSVETDVGTVLGTPYYLAPERALGKALDPRADLYSLGVILYELLTGNVPFVSDTFMGILALHVKAEPLDPRQAAPDRAIPDRVAQLTMKLLEKEPEARPPTGEAVATEIDDILRTEAQAVAAVTLGPRPRAGAGDMTMRMDDVADRPTTAPADTEMLPVVGADTAVMDGPMTSFAEGPAVRTHFETSFSEPPPKRGVSPLVWGIPVVLLAVGAAVVLGRPGATPPAPPPTGDPASPGAPAGVAAPAAVPEPAPAPAPAPKEPERPAREPDAAPASTQASPSHADAPSGAAAESGTNPPETPAPAPKAAGKSGKHKPAGNKKRGGKKKSGGKKKPDGLPTLPDDDLY